MQYEGYDSCLFSAEERAFARMLDNGGILVGDRWFPAGSSELERAKYLVAYHLRLERNRRRREKRHSGPRPICPRNVRGHVSIDDKTQMRHRYFLERSKCVRRATVARCPTANEIRTAWAHRLKSPAGSLRLGGMLLDLECFVDNSLWRTYRGGHPLIVGRSRGLLGWIREKCPELVCKYKTMMRYKALAKNLRQTLGVSDPVPTAILLDAATDPAVLAGLPLHVQPRPSADGDDYRLMRHRFVWEVSGIDVDAKRRCFRYNENYRRISNDSSHLKSSAGRIAELREKLQDILLNGKGIRTIEKYAAAPDGVPSRPAKKPICGDYGEDGERYGAATTVEEAGLEGRADRRVQEENVPGTMEALTRLKGSEAGTTWLERTIEFWIEEVQTANSRRRKRRPGKVIEDALNAWMSIPSQLMRLPYYTKSDLIDE